LIFSQTGEVKDGFYVLGSRNAPVYLQRAQKPALFDAGIVKLSRVYEDEVRGVLREIPPEMLFLTHVHFDHCGAVSYLKRRFPGLTVAASRKASEILKRPNAVKLIQALSESAAEALAAMGESGLSDEAFEPFDVDMILEDGDVIKLEGGLTVQVLSTPGHTWDFLSYYIPEKKILIASEAGGCANILGDISTDCLTDFGLYLDSLRRLAALDVDVLCQGHRFVYVGQDAKAFLPRSIQAALEFKDMVQESWEAEHGDLARTMARIKEIEYDPLPLRKQPEPAYLINLGARVKSLLAFLGLEKKPSL
jgi:glyoxylase-like metal-dependent hydrolase (beta-lactamase superfamily II)